MEEYEYDDYRDYVVEIWKDDDMSEAEYFDECNEYNSLEGVMHHFMTGFGYPSPRAIYELNGNGDILDIYELQPKYGGDDVSCWIRVETIQRKKRTKLVGGENDRWELRVIPPEIREAVPKAYPSGYAFYDIYQSKESHRPYEDDEYVVGPVLQYIDGLKVWYYDISEYRKNVGLEYWTDCDPYADMIGDVKAEEPEKGLYDPPSYERHFYSTIPRGEFPIYSTFIKATQVSGDDLNDILERWTYEINRHGRVENIHKEWLGIINREDAKHGKDISKEYLKAYLLKIKERGYDISILDLEDIYDGDDLEELIGDRVEEDDKPKYHWTEFTLLKIGGNGSYGDGLLKYFQKDAKFPFATRRRYIEEMYLYRKGIDNHTACFTRPYKESSAWEACKDIFLAFCAEHRKEGQEDYFLEYHFDVTNPNMDWNKSRRGRAKWGRFLGEVSTKEYDIWDWGPPVDTIDWTGFDEKYGEYNHENSNYKVVDSSAWIRQQFHRE